MNRKILAVIAVFIVLGGLYYFSTRQKNTAPANQPVTSMSKPDLADATYSTEDGPLTFSNGTATRSIVPGSALTEETTLTDVMENGDLNGDGKQDAVGIFVKNGAGSGVFIYLAAVISGPVSYKGTNMVFVGDRVTPKSIKISGSTITVNYLDRDPGEPFSADPTVQASKDFIYKNGELSEK